MQDKISEFCFKNFILNYGIDVRGKVLKVERPIRGHVIDHVREKIKAQLAVTKVGLGRKS